jgi:hypothetical protein
MTATIGQDCHVILSHPDISAGAYYGFVCPKDGSNHEGGVEFIREVSSDPAIGTDLWVYFDVILADDLKQPDGTKRPYTRAQDYAKLLLYLAKQDNLTVISPAGAMVGLGALGFAADERHMPKHSIIKCQFNNKGTYFPPVSADRVRLSVWDGSLLWSTALWV